MLPDKISIGLYYRFANPTGDHLLVDPVDPAGKNEDGLSGVNRAEDK